MRCGYGVCRNLAVGVVLALCGLLSACTQSMPEPAGPEMSDQEAMEATMPGMSQFMSGEEPGQEAMKKFDPGYSRPDYPGSSGGR